MNSFKRLALAALSLAILPTLAHAQDGKWSTIRRDVTISAQSSQKLRV